MVYFPQITRIYTQIMQFFRPVGRPKSDTRFCVRFNTLGLNVLTYLSQYESVMKKSELNNNKSLGAPLTDDALRQVKGGYRAMPGQQQGRLHTRWDEVDLRLQDDEESHILISLPDGSEKQGMVLGKK